MDQQLIERPDDVDVRAVLKGANQELKRVACERLGWERVLGAVGASELQRDDYGILLETDSLGDGDPRARFARVVCPSTGREYVLRVPPDTTTARGGIAWTFQMTEEAYAPELQT